MPRLIEVRFHQVHIPLRKAVRHASQSRTSTDSLVVRAAFDDGSVGWGEGLPRHYVTGETIEEMWGTIDHLTWDDLPTGPWAGVGDCIAQLRAWDLAVTLADPRRCRGHSLRCAIELAILDAACRSARLSMQSVSQAVPEWSTSAEPLSRVRYSAAIPAISLPRLLRRVIQLRYYDFAAAKVKVGLSAAREWLSLRLLRGLLPRDFSLRIDANEAWTRPDLEQALPQLERLRICSIEQPVPHANLASLAGTRGRWPIPIMLDESACSRVDIDAAAACGAGDAVNLRLSKFGGYLRALEAAHQARRLGYALQLGCQVGETGILSAAGRHFASSLPDLQFIEGSYDRFLVRECLTREDLTFGRGGWAPALTGPGLGVEVDEVAVARVTRQSRVLAGG